VKVAQMDRDGGRGLEFVIYEPGTGKEIVKLSVTLGETEELIECREKNAEEVEEEMKSASGTDRPEQGKKQGIC
jgi:hypothetical protein